MAPPPGPSAAHVADVGIVEFASQTAGGIGGELKVQPADFQVNEIDMDGQEVVTEDIVTVVTADHCDSEGEEEHGQDGSCVGFVLFKEKLDTLGATGELAALLGVPSRNFSFAGLKDFRAVTTQRVSVKGVSQARLKSIRHPQLKLSHIRRAARPIRLGELGGNRFRIALRRTSGGRLAVEAALGALRDEGFVNYYGLQRFGDCASRNDMVGRCLLMGEYAAAVDAVMRGDDTAQRGSSAEREARDVWIGSGDARRAFRLMPRSKPLERELLRRLAGQPDSALPSASYEARCRSAVLGLPLSIRRLLAHAYFSRVWNIVASERLRRFGTAPAREGELVIPPQLGPKAMGSPFSRRSAVVGGGQRHTAHLPRLTAHRTAPYAPSCPRRESVHVVTASEATQAAYDARCIVFPLPGEAVCFPRTETGNLYRQMLWHDGLDPEAPAIERSASREDDDNWMLLQGDYRQLLLRPLNMTWQLLPNAKQSPQDQPPASPLPHGPHSGLCSNGSGSAVVEVDHSAKTAALAETIDVAVQFDLPAGAYATMALREAMQPRPLPSRRLGHIRFE